MENLLKKSERISQFAAWGSGTILFLASIMIAVEVVLRKAFAISMGGADELSSYALAISCSWGFGYALFKKAHIRIDVIYVRVPPMVRNIMDLLALVLFGLYMVILSYFAFSVVSTSFSKSSVANTPLATPLWIPQGLWLLGIVGFTITIFLILTGTVYYLSTGRRSEANKLSGASTLDEEIEEETRATESQTPDTNGETS